MLTKVTDNSTRMILFFILFSFWLWLADRRECGLFGRSVFQMKLGAVHVFRYGV